ncbi:GSCFA domain-containing protein [Myroides marinus]|uniref:GSCFA domain-containing protein n=1 Tax=Myroides marinus TaxID=703342 RepID=UPI002576E9A6|nr:GSCFA domain-containing protein [Myroides marinus]MDM1378245.1 GSCFA domain-containing protein [Myroides marinus]MDM1385369.1 GSCFA domain-containing protein [Myroides marinus]MDM1392582.1 GSCFA domain-containing protein [Myroides marinus]
MKFSTVVPTKVAKDRIKYEHKILSMGSCFAVNISDKLKEYQFQSVVNPFGILFHPFAIERVLEYAVDGYEFTSKDVFCHNEVWSSFIAHSDLNELEEEDIVTKLNVKLFDLQVALKESSFMYITLGTAWVYEHIESGMVVANCHKVPQSNFKKRLLSYGEVSASLSKIIKLVQAINPELQIVFTVSPVRHFKDGIVENQRSKSVLFTALHDVLDRQEEVSIGYFPSYEIVMDELRDYRYYKADMLHPNELAIDYIWERFVTTWIHPDMYPIMHKVDEVQRGLNHRPFNPTAEQHLKFLDTLVEKIDYLLEKYPFMSFR